MAQLALGVAGAAIGSFFGPLGASIGFSLGSAIGGALFGPKGPDGPRMTDLKLQTSQFGQMVPIVWGTERLAFQVIDQTDLVEHSHSSNGKGGGGPTTYSYTASFAVAICEGPILGVLRIWADGRIIYDVTGATDVDNDSIPVTFYLGSETQLPDPTFEAIHGVGNVSAYRGTAYAVFTDMEMASFYNRIPNLEFEVYTEGAGGGTIPWRVNTASFWAAEPGGSSAITYGSYYDIGTDTLHAYQYLNINVQFMEQATSDVTTASPTVSGVVNGPTTLDTFPDGGIARSTVPGQGNVLGAPAIFCFNVSDNTQVAWYYKNRYITAVTSNPWPAGDAFHAVLGSNSVFDGEFIYAVCFDNTTGRTGVSAWAAGGGVPGNAHIGCVNLSASSFSGISQIYFATTETPGVFYIAISNAGSGHGDELFQCQVGMSTIDVLYHWDQSDAAHTTPVEFSGQSSNFVVYHDYIAFKTGTGPTRVFDVMLLNADYSITPVGNIDPIAAGANCVRLTRGFVRGTDGVYSLDPPGPVNGKVPLSEIVGGGGNVRGLCERAGLDSTQYDASELTDTVAGYKLAEQGAIRSAIETLQPAYFFDGLERDTIAAFPKRGGASVATLTVDDVGAYEGGQEPANPREFTHGHDDDLPRQVSVVYQNSEADYQPGSQPAQRQVGNATAVVNIQLPIVMTSTEARAIAEANLLQAHVERDKFAASTSRKYLHLEPTDVVTLIDRAVRLTEKAETPGGLLSWKATATSPNIYVPTATGSSGEGFTEPTATPGQGAQMFLLDIPMPDDLDARTSFYVAMAGDTDGSTWRGGTLWQSKDAGATYAQVATVNTANVIGSAALALPDFGGGDVVDESSSLTVIIGNGGGTLSSCTRDALLGGANYALIGDELVQFMRATLTGTDTYLLTGFLRGRRGTEWAMSQHDTDETFILLPVTEVPMGFSDLGREFLYRAVSNGQTLTDAAPQSFTNTGQGLRPYAPAQLGGGVNGAGDVLVHWRRRTRQGGAWQDFTDVPLSEITEGYVVEFWDSAYAVCARTIETTTQSATYTAAEQVTDFGAAQQTYYVTAAQKSDYQLGRRTRGTIPGTGGSNNAPLAPITSYNGTFT